MKYLLATAIAAALVAGPVSAQRVREREKNQQERIAEGVKSKELTRKEAVKLEKKEAQLHKEIRRDRVDGGGLTAKERVKIERKQDKLSRDIAKEKHDKQDRK